MINPKKKDYSKEAVKGVSWNLVNRTVSNGGQVIIYVVLARLLTPEDFGVIAVIGVLLNISRVFSTAGLGASIVQEKGKRTSKIYSIYTFTFLLSALISLSLVLLSPSISSYYSEIPDLSFFILISSPAIIFSSINSIQMAILQRDLRFKSIFIASSIPIFISGAISIYLAYSGYGVISLIANTVLTSMLSIILTFLLYVELPSPSFKFKTILSSLNYSYKILLSALLEEGYRSLYTLLIAKIYGKELLGNYNFGRQMPVFVTSTVNATIATILFPFYSRVKDLNTNLNYIYKDNLNTINFLLLPFVFMVFLISEDFIIVLFTEKWIGSLFYLEMFTIIYGLHHLHSKIYYYLNAIGRSDVSLKYDFIKKAIGIVILILTIKMSLEAIVIGQVIGAVISIIVIMFPTKTYLKINLWDQFKDMSRIAILNLVTYAILLIIVDLINTGIFRLMLVPIFYLLIYAALSYLMKFRELFYTIKILKIGINK